MRKNGFHSCVVEQIPFLSSHAEDFSFFGPMCSNSNQQRVALAHQTLDRLIPTSSHLKKSISPFSGDQQQHQQHGKKEKEKNIKSREKATFSQSKARKGSEEKRKTTVQKKTTKAAGRICAPHQKRFVPKLFESIATTSNLKKVGKHEGKKTESTKDFLLRLASINTDFMKSIIKKAV